MGSGDPITGDNQRPTTKPRSYLFAVRLWKEGVAGGTEYRGTVRDVMDGVFHNFRDWSELATFMRARIDEDERVQAGLFEDGVRKRSEAIRPPDSEL
jgi:hypothetical protein